MCRRRQNGAVTRSQADVRQAIRKQLFTRKGSKGATCLVRFSSRPRVCALPNSRPFQMEAYHNPPVQCASLLLVLSISSASGAWPARPPNPGSSGLPVVVSGTGFPALLPGLKYKKTQGKSEGNHVLVNLFLLPRLINTATPLVR